MTVEVVATARLFQVASTLLICPRLGKGDPCYLGRWARRRIAEDRGSIARVVDMLRVTSRMTVTWTQLMAVALTNPNLLSRPVLSRTVPVVGGRFLLEAQLR
jgi:hypothetical protein